VLAPVIKDEHTLVAPAAPAVAPEQP